MNRDTFQSRGLVGTWRASPVKARERNGTFRRTSVLAKTLPADFAGEDMTELETANNYNSSAFEN